MRLVWIYYFLVNQKYSKAYIVKLRINKKERDLVISLFVASLLDRADIALPTCTRTFITHYSLLITDRANKLTCPNQSTYCDILVQ